MFTPADGKYAMSNSLTELLFASFQATFAGITCALVVGSFAERARFSAVLVFTVIWFTFAYVPIAHMVWFASETAPGLLNARARWTSPAARWCTSTPAWPAWSAPM